LNVQAFNMAQSPPSPLQQIRCSSPSDDNTGRPSGAHKMDSTTSNHMLAQCNALTISTILYLYTKTKTTK
jgi:hypothetical protein